MHRRDKYKIVVRLLAFAKWADVRC